MEDKKLEEYFTRFDEKFEELNSRMGSLQDLVLRMKSGFDILARSKVQDDCLSQMTKVVDENTKIFLDNRPQNCQILDECTTFVERGALKVLRVFMEEGAQKALNLLNSRNEFLEKGTEVKVCPDKECLNQAMTIFTALEELITTSEEASIQYAKDLFSLGEEEHRKNSSSSSPFTDLLLTHFHWLIDYGRTRTSLLIKP